MHALEVHNTTRGAIVGECIYCGSVDGLSDEHVVPLSLGGKFVLPLASCKNCSAITSAFEREVTRGFMRDARVVAGFPTRRPKQRPSQLPIQVSRDGQFEEVNLATDAFPAFLHLPLLSAPGLFDARLNVTGVDVQGYETIHFGKDTAAVARDLKTDTIRATVNWDVTSFARLLAKASYGFAVGSLGILPRDEVPILPLILGKADDASVWLGTVAFSLAIEQKCPTHSGRFDWLEDPERPGRPLLFAKLKLFANSGATGYGVVVWRPVRPDPRVPKRRA
jgi:hypothetical protein